MIRFMTLLVGLVNESITVNIRFARMNGLTYGKVIFQKYSQAVAPSIWAASLADGGMFWSAARNRSICMPELQTMPKILSVTVEIMVLMLSLRP